MAVIRPSFNINDMETGEQFAHTMRSLDLNIPIAPDSCMLKKEAEVYGRKLQNSIVIQPMEGLDASADGSPGPLTFARYSNFARQGAGTIWFEAAAVTSDGRDSLHQLWLNAGNADVHTFHILFAHVQTTRCVEDVDLATHQQTDAVHLAWNHVHVLEIQQRTRPLNARAVLRHPKHFQTLLRGGEDHLLKAAVGVARCHSMGMYV